ncbi:MAG: hypothetical protein JEZ07_03365 [Phycisphaerae bacterium]|nr:hypothetical protein [Phycisphaerae bacterium]
MKMHNKAGLVLVVFLLIINCSLIQAGTWNGSNLVKNGTFESGLNYWAGVNDNTLRDGRWITRDTNGNNNYFAHFTGVNGSQYQSGTLSQRGIQIQNGKRYKFQCYYSGYKDYCYCGFVVDNLFEKSLSDGSSNYAKVSIASTSTTNINFKTRKNGYSNTFKPAFDNIQLYQVVYSPVLEIAPNVIRINTNSPSGSVADINVALNSLSYPDEPTSWSMDWGDGVTISKPDLNETYSHSFTIANGLSQEWALGFSGDNNAGSSLVEAEVTVLKQPALEFTINGQALENGDTFTVDILDDTQLTLNALFSQGFIEEVSFTIPDKVESAGSMPADYLYMGSPFDYSDLGQTYPLTVKVSNTGLGTNEDSITINLYIGTSEGDVVHFNDSNLQALVEEELAKSNLYPPFIDYDMLKLTSLNGNNITDLTGLEYALNLTELDLPNGSIADLSPVANLNNLTWLNFENNNISDISVLEEMQSLQEVNLNSNNILDISCFVNATGLISLQLRHNSLNSAAFCVYIPVIKINNPRIYLSSGIAKTGLDGDCNGDGVANMHDFATITSFWMDSNCGLCNGADIDGDSQVDQSDLFVLASNWLEMVDMEVYIELLNNFPNWIFSGDWEYGQPLGLGGELFGYPDPVSGNTGNNVIGTNLSGDYNTNPAEAFYATSEAIDCRYFKNIKLIFSRWLNIDESDYVQCFIEVSNNGSNWETVWEHDGRSITDNQWIYVEYDVSNIADGQEAVYIRFGYEVIGDAYSYSGWNIDDIKFVGNTGL